MSKKYEITTVKDIFDNVPVEKIDMCLRELAELMKRAKRMNNVLCITVGLVIGKEPLQAIEWPETITWVDDDKGEIITRYIAPDGENIITTKTTLEQGT